MHPHGLPLGDKHFAEVPMATAIHVSTVHSYPGLLCLRPQLSPLPSGHCGSIGHIGCDPAYGTQIIVKEEIPSALGEILAAGDARPEVADQIAAHVVWLDDKPAAARPHVCSRDRWTAGDRDR